MKYTDEEIAHLKLPTKPANRAEVDGFNYLSACVTDLEFAQEHMEKRIRLIPDGWREFRMIQARLEQLVKIMVMTFEPEKQMQIWRTSRVMRHKLIYAPEVVREKDKFLIPSDDLGMLITAAGEACKMRMCTAAECNKCKLAKTLDGYSFVTRGKHRAWWEVFSAASQAESDDVVV